MISSYNGWWNRADRNDSVMLGPPGRIRSLDTSHILIKVSAQDSQIGHQFVCLSV